MELPETWRFLGASWWMLHIIAITLVFYLGYIIGRSRAEEQQETQKAHEHDDK